MASLPLDLVIRADATPVVGAGHVMRCAALAEAWTRAKLGAVRVQGNITIPFVQERLRVLGIQAAGERDGAAVLLVDCYDAVERTRLGRRSGVGVRVLVDDLGEHVPEGYDAVWNPNAYGSVALYPGFRGAVIGGPHAIPLRGSLPSWSGEGRPTVGVSLGAGGASPALRAALTALACEAGEDSFVASGDWAPSGWGRAGVDSPWTTLATCGRLLTAGGSTVWEAAAIGIPTMVVKTAANQSLAVAWLAERGIPVVDGLKSSDGRQLADLLREALTRAVQLPRLASGAEAVARTLEDLAKQRAKAR